MFTSAESANIIDQLPLDFSMNWHVPAYPKDLSDLPAFLRMQCDPFVCEEF